jgi:holo-[acyl-carrier protein] synthase
MLVGLGIDVVGVARVARALTRDPESYPRELLVAEELADWQRGLPARLAHDLASRFAAKEAAIKALAAAPGDLGYFREVLIEGATSPAPSLAFRGRLAALAAERGVCRAHLCVTHTRELAAAVVALER